MNNSVPSAELCGKNKCLQLKDNNLPSVPGTMVKALFRESGNQACNVRLIFTGFEIQFISIYLAQILVNPAGASISVSPKGWTDSELGSLWMQKDFIPMSAARNKFGYWILLIHDGHNSHCTYKFIALAEKHKIKPCNVGIFSPLATTWKACSLMDPCIEYAVFDICLKGGIQVYHNHFSIPQNSCWGHLGCELCTDEAHGLQNEWLRQKTFVKKKQVAVNTSATCHLTSDEMLEGLAFADHKKGMAAMFLQLKSKLKGIKKRLAAAEGH
ncbi:hypothetical protein BT96DRAFT_951544 [Gymnopus androsaceus JB14]|uniref:DDE-1 domain-containing protein n=1 Tax=Gymnopus androsaceus JB14 TaxID=1447944 RepID=A0A6A4GCF5_9AGAR|nr:hypothetical protein BT96DRAFT_951544 [Gymnopus androsaceus JB14]